MAFQLESRVEVFVPGGQELLLKPSDMTVALLSRVFKMKPETIYLEEDVTNHAEFPNDDSRFDLGNLPGKYKVCGEPIAAHAAESAPQTTSRLDVQSEPRPHFTLSSSRTGQDWGRPWQPGASTSRKEPQHGNGLSLSRKKPRYENQLRRTIPFVSLCADHTGKKMSVDTIITNLYVKIPESEVSMQAILSDVAPKVDCAVEDLTMLDSTLVPLTEEDRDIEYWRVPSRRLYITKVAEYQELATITRRKRLSLRKRTRSELNDDMEDASSEQLDRIESSVGKVADEMESVKVNSQRAIRTLIHLMDCKICKQVPTNPVMVTCCSQVFGCQTCFDQTMNQHSTCSLCRSELPHAIPIKGYEPLFDYLRTMD